MSDTAARLSAYKAAELRILQAQSIAHDGRAQTNTQLNEVRAAITALEAKLAAENRAACGQFGPVTLVADFSRKLP